MAIVIIILFILMVMAGLGASYIFFTEAIEAVKKYGNPFFYYFISSCMVLVCLGFPVLLLVLALQKCCYIQ